MTADVDHDLATAPTLAAWLGVTAKTIRELTASGVVVKASHGRYRLRESVCNYITTLRERAAGRGGEQLAATAAADRARLARAKAETAELQNARLRGALLESAAVEQEWSGVLRTVRAGMLAVPSRCQQRLPHLTAADVSALDREVRDALTEIGSDRAATTL